MDQSIGTRSTGSRSRYNTIFTLSDFFRDGIYSSQELKVQWDNVYSNNIYDVTNGVRQSTHVSLCARAPAGPPFGARAVNFVFGARNSHKSVF